MDEIKIIKKTGTIYLPDDAAEKFNKINQKYSLVSQNPSVKEVENKAYYLFGKKEYLTRNDFNEIKDKINKPMKNREDVYQDINLEVNNKEYDLSYHGNEAKSHVLLSYKGDKNDPQKFMIYKIKLNDIRKEFDFINDILKARSAPQMDGAMRRNINIDTTKYETPLKISISYNTFFKDPNKIKNIFRKASNLKNYKIVIT